jgi:pilus assembly protein CpaB
MRLSSVLMLLGSVGLAAVAGVMAQSWLEQQRKTSAPVVVQKRIETSKIVVASQPLRFGTELVAANLREIEWPSGAIPSGAFTSADDLLKGTERRAVLSAIEPNEPILKWKITGPGQRASLSALIGPGMKAVTIRVNDVNGIAGFVLPGDRVDVLLTRTEQDPSDKTRKQKFSDIILQHVRVLGVDQMADDRSEKAVVAKAVTLEVTGEDAQRLTLAADVGSLSLALRSAGAIGTSDAQRITTEDLGHSFGVLNAVSEDGRRISVPTAHKVVVTRRVTRQEYTVPSYGAPTETSPPNETSEPVETSMRTSPPKFQ